MWPEEERRNTYVATARSTHILTLAEIKSHLRVDDTTAGVAASATLGTGNSQLKLTNRLAGAFGNAYTLTIAVSGNNTALSVSLANNVYTVTSATNSGGSATSTVNDVIAALAAVCLAARTPTFQEPASPAAGSDDAVANARPS